MRQMWIIARNRASQIHNAPTHKTIPMNARAPLHRFLSVSVNDDGYQQCYEYDKCRDCRCGEQGQLRVLSSFNPRRWVGSTRRQRWRLTGLGAPMPNMICRQGVNKGQDCRNAKRDKQSGYHTKQGRLPHHSSSRHLEPRRLISFGRPADTCAKRVARAHQPSRFLILDSITNAKMTEYNPNSRPPSTLDAVIMPDPDHQPSR
jgi:hypothetical protein